MNYIHSLLSRPWFSLHRLPSNAVATRDALASSPPRTEEQVPTVNNHSNGGIRDTSNASGVESVGVPVAMANVQPESSVRGTLKTDEAATAGDSAGDAFRQADGKIAAGYHINSSDRSPVQSADKSKTQQVAPEQVSLIDTAATQVADEQLKTLRACTPDGDHIDSARTDDALSHGRNSGTEGLTMEAEVESSDGAKQHGIPAHRQQEGKKVAPKRTQRSSLPPSKRQLAKALDYRKPGFANPHSNLQARYHASQAWSKKLNSRITALTNDAADISAELVEADKKKKASDVECDRLLERLKAQHREAGLSEDQIKGKVNDAWTGAARQKQEKAAAAAARAQALPDDWLTEPSAPPSESCVKGRKSSAGKGKASQSDVQAEKHKQAPQQLGTDDCAEAALDDSDNEEVVTDITPQSHEGFDQVASSSFAKHAVAAIALRSTRSVSSAPLPPHTIAQSAPSQTLAQNQTDSIRLGNLSDRAFRDWKVQMAQHEARVFIEAQPSNQLANGTLRIFHPRDEEKFLRPEEVWKMDLHTPKTLRDRGRTLEATLAGDAVKVYLKILQNHLYGFLPGEGNTLVTGTGRRTGGRTFHQVGQRLFQLLGTVVSRYTAHEDWGAYTVWLLCPSKANRRLR